MGECLEGDGGVGWAKAFLYIDELVEQEEVG
jgi:hypothetical protein